MPEQGARGRGLDAEAGQSPQSKQHGSSSTRNIQNEYTSDSDKASQFCVALSFNLLNKNASLILRINLKSTRYSLKIMSIYPFYLM